MMFNDEATRDAPQPVFLPQPLRQSPLSKHSISASAFARGRLAASERRSARETDADIFVFDDLYTSPGDLSSEDTVNADSDDVRTPRPSIQSPASTDGPRTPLVPTPRARLPPSSVRESDEDQLSCSLASISTSVTDHDNPDLSDIDEESKARDISETGVEVVFKKKKKKKKTRPVTFEDKYELTGNHLGKGASATVKECRCKADGILYAAKIASKSNHNVNREQVFREVELLEECRGHENILQLKDFYETTEDFIFVFEKIDGGPLFDHIQREKRFTETQAREVIRDMSRALSFIHNLGIAHRDLKPENILCVYADRISPAKLCDFNLVSKPVKLGQTPPMTLAVGTPEFMAPEIAALITSGEQRAYDKRCDIWSLGIILYILLFGTPPFSGDCGANCGWKRGASCEDCAEILLENIQDMHLTFPDSPRVSSAAKDLIMRMLVPECDRITADEILFHPWITQQLPESQPLSTPNLLRQKGYADDLSRFTSQANVKNRSIESDSSFNLKPPTASEIQRRRQVTFSHSPNSLRNVDLSEIKTPKFSAIRF